MMTWLWRIVTLGGLLCAGYVIYRARELGRDETLGYMLLGMPALVLGARDAWRKKNPHQAQ